MPDDNDKDEQQQLLEQFCRMGEFFAAEREAMVMRVRESCASIAEFGDPDDEANQWHPTSQMGVAGKRIAVLIRKQNET